MTSRDSILHSGGCKYRLDLLVGSVVVSGVWWRVLRQLQFPPPGFGQGEQRGSKDKRLGTRLLSTFICDQLTPRLCPSCRGRRFDKILFLCFTGCCRVAPATRGIAAAERCPAAWGHAAQQPIMRLAAAGTMRASALRLPCRFCRAGCPHPAVRQPPGRGRRPRRPVPASGQ